MPIVTSSPRRSLVVTSPLWSGKRRPFRWYMWAVPLYAPPARKVALRVVGVTGPRDDSDQEIRSKLAQQGSLPLVAPVGAARARKRRGQGMHAGFLLSHACPDFLSPPPAVSLLSFTEAIELLPRSRPAAR